jgi:hypothetical protein
VSARTDAFTPEERKLISEALYLAASQAFSFVEDAERDGEGAEVSSVKKNAVASVALAEEFEK